MKKLKLNNDRPWIKYYKPWVNPNLKYSDASMVGFLLENISKHPENIAYEYYGNEVNYREFYRQIKETAKSLKAQGVKENDKISICMPNTPSALMMFYAANMVGAIVSMIHPLSAEKEIETYLNESDSTLLLVLDAVYDKVNNIIASTNVKKIIVATVGDNLKIYKRVLYKYNPRRKAPKIEYSDDVLTWGEFLNYGYDYEGEIICLRKAEDPAVILYSGGTTGTPKGILLSNLNFNALALQSMLMCDPVDPSYTNLAILPIFHGFGLGVCIHTPLCIGMKNVLLPDFSPKKIIKTIKKYQVNLLCAVPSLYEYIAKEAKIGKKDLSSLKCCVSGGDFMDANLKHMIDNCLKEHGSSAEIRIGYGLTEASAATCLTPSGEYKDNSIGVPFPDTYYKIVKFGSLEEVNHGVDGEICIKGPTVMLGYINNIEENLKTLMKHEDGDIWLHTGDVGYMDDDGVVFYKQRAKRIIISNGYNVYPSHVESVINTHKDVLSSVVIGIPHPRKVQVPKAIVVLKDGIKPSKELEKEIMNLCDKNLARYALPVSIEFRDSLPKTLVGKVAYRKL